MYCANIDDGTVSVIDCATKRVVAAIEVGNSTNGLCCSPTHNKVYATNLYGNYVSVIDCATDSVTATVPVGDDPGFLCYDPGGDRVYCANRHDSRGIRGTVNDY